MLRLKYHDKCKCGILMRDPFGAYHFLRGRELVLVCPCHRVRSSPLRREHPQATQPAQRRQAPQLLTASNHAALARAQACTKAALAAHQCFFFYVLQYVRT